MEFKKGDKVIVTGVTLYGSFEGCEGVIIRQGMFHDWLVDVAFPDGTHDDLSFDAHELAPATEAQPANDNRDTGWSQRDMDELGFSAMGLQPAPADAPAVDSAASPSTWTLPAEMVTPEVQAVLSRLSEQLAAVTDALKPFAFCPIHPDWADDTRCVILMNWNKPGLEVSVNEGLTLADVRRAVAALKATSE